MPSSTTTPVPYFPPPPRSAAVGNPKFRSRSSSLTATKLKSSRSSKCRPSAVHRSRTFLVPIILIVTFAIIVLSIIFGYCVATPHTQVTAGEKDSHTNSPTSSPSTSGTTQDYSPTAALVFYLLTCPMALLCLLSVELLLHHHYYYFYGKAAKSSLLSSWSIFNINARLPSFCFLFLHLVTLLAFTLSTSFWTACEIPPPTSTALDRLCPAQVRGHFMYGIHELSIAKVAMGWAVVVGLALHIWCQVKTRRAARNSRRSRWAIDAAQADYGKNDVEVVVVDERDSDTAAAAAAGTKNNGASLVAVDTQKWLD
ncbi:hypothetical protein DV736_g5523, partial [Chaetothyriales sp. CBS 134916]